jgi:hypothetical protein
VILSLLLVGAVGCLVGSTLLSRPGHAADRGTPEPTRDTTAADDVLSGPSPSPSPNGRPTPTPNGRPNPAPSGRPTPSPSGRPTPNPSGHPTPRASGHPRAGIPRHRALRQALRESQRPEQTPDHAFTAALRSAAAATEPAGPPLVRAPGREATPDLGPRPGAARLWETPRAADGGAAPPSPGPSAKAATDPTTPGPRSR